MSTNRKPPTPIEPEWESVSGAQGGGGSSAASPSEPARTVMMDPGVALSVRGSQADAFLVVVAGPNVGHRYPLETVTLLGRSSSADVPLVDDRVSGRHCEVSRTPQGYRVKDLGSSNGTLVNAEKISEVELRDGDLVQVGFTVFKFQSSVARVADPQVMGPGMGMGMGMGGMPVSGMGMGGMPMSGMGQGGMPMSGMGMGGMPMSGMGMGGMPMSGMGMGGMPMAGMGMGGMPMAGMGMGGMPVTQPQAPRAAEEEMNLEEMVGNVRKIAEFFLPFKKVIGIAAAVGLVGGIALAIVSPPAAKATFEMNILTGADKGQGGVATDRAQAAKSNFKSTVLLSMTLKNLGQTDISDDRIAVLQKNLIFESTTPNYGVPPPVQNFVGEFMAATEENALLFLQTHVKTFIDSEVDKTTKVIASKLDYLGDQIKKAEETLKSSDEELKEFKKKYLASLPENAAKSQEFVFELQKTESELSSSVEQLKLEIQSASSGGGGRKARAVQQVKEEIAELKAQGLGDNHPDVVAVKQRLVRIEAAPDDAGPGRSGDKTIGQLKAEMSAKTMQLEQTRKQLETVRAAQASLPDFEARYADLTRSYDSSKKLYDQLFQEKNSTEYTLGFEKTAAEARFEIVVPPRVEKQSAGKAYAKKVAIGLVGGIACGFGLAAFLQILAIWRRK